MTTEKAIQLLHRLSDEQFDGIHGDERREALEMAVRALSGDGDLISRQAVIMAVKTGALSAAMIFGRTDEGATAYYETVKAIKALPSAQPQCKKGQLLYHHTENIDEVKTADVYFCSFCKKEVLKKIRFGMFKGELDIKYGYCPHCGADMRGE